MVMIRIYMYIYIYIYIYIYVDYPVVCYCCYCSCLKRVTFYLHCLILLTHIRPCVSISIDGTPPDGGNGDDELRPRLSRRSSSQEIVLAWTSNFPKTILVDSLVDSSTRFAILAVPNVPFQLSILMTCLIMNV